jgi:hypothetical protein
VVTFVTTVHAAAKFLLSPSSDVGNNVFLGARKRRGKKKEEEANRKDWNLDRSALLSCDFWLGKIK